MKFQKGQSGNPGGRKRSLGLSRAVRESEGLKAWARLLNICHAKVREEKIVHEDAEDVVIDVVPSIKDQREAARLILAYCWGTPGQKTEFSSKTLMQAGGDVQAFIVGVANALLRGDVAPAAASSLASLMQTSLKIREAEEIERRLKAIEERIALRR